MVFVIFGGECGCAVEWGARLSGETRYTSIIPNIHKETSLPEQRALHLATLLFLAKQMLTCLYFWSWS